MAILNKFNVVDHHLLIVAREFEDQRALLALRDFEAWWRCMSEYDSLGFYNGGPEAGASQPHKHLQLVPLPLAPQGPPVPIAPLLARVRGTAGAGTIPGFDFLHSFAVSARRQASAPRPGRPSSATFRCSSRSACTRLPARAPTCRAAPIIWS